ncbi:cyanuric acid amidohydrolase [Pigmentiphaga sp. NML080357]|uniref:cyanuric acid amidohydrolase n=1 Tax=Pigmentiphaga sp. NML080357 TaxID=2008675 RepID=UPI000B40E059|nr:ring-opening amidohydrolase [Pigmentiphaga sp. NML080357]OVZ59056.1 cyanuric acid amidohydrolase [Pigmentiphaga sp. NML080357]
MTGRAETAGRRAQVVGVHRVSCRGPGDLSGVRALVDAGELDPRQIVAVMGKTEGNGCVNDHTREYAAVSWCHFLAPYLGCSPAEAESRVALVMSGGTEGVLSPHFTVFTRRFAEAADAPPADKRLVVGVAHTRDFAPEEIGRAAQIDATAEAVKAAMADAGIASAADVHFVQVKCPLLTSAKVNDALSRSADPVTRDTYESMGYSRGASALGVAVATGEVARERVGDASVLNDWSLWSARASVSAGIELEGNVVIVLGEAQGSLSPYRMAHTLMRDAVDAASVRAMLRESFGLDPDRDAEALGQRLVNLLAKAEASPDGGVRGQRHTMLNDSDINATRHARAAVGGVLASVAGHTALYVSGGAEHQGPPGGGPVAAILRIEAPPLLRE